MILCLVSIITFHSIMLMQLCYIMLMLLCYCKCMYVSKHIWCMYVCMHAYMYILTSIFRQTDMHEYVAMYICMEVRIHVYVGKHA